MGYTAPPSTQIPFTFTEGGYEAPSGELLFQFGLGQGFSNLNAAIQVMQLYHDEAYTYVKSCPKYVIGYADGKVQIIKGPCTYGGIRDLWSSIDGISTLSDTRDLLSIIRGTGSTTIDLPSSISAHLPGDLRSIIKATGEAFADLPSSIHGWQQSDLYSIILMHPPEDLAASIFVKSTAYTDLPASVHAWHIGDLQSILGRVFPNDLPVVINMVHPVDLPAYLKVRYAVDLNSILRTWAIKDLTSIINSIFSYDLPVSIYGRDDMFKNLYSRIKGVGIREQRSLGATIRSLIGVDLNAYLIATYLKDLPSYIFPVVPSNIGSSIYGWVTSDLQATLISQRSGYDLSASIFPNENLKYLGSSIRSMIGTEIIHDLPATVYSWETSNLTSHIGLIAAGNLQVLINPRMYSEDLHSSIYPKMIRLSTLVKVATMAHRDLSAMINSFCVHSDHKNLSASIHTIYKSDLYSYIKALRYSYKPALLGASIGFADSMTDVDKYSISLNILPGEMKTFDRYPISFNLWRSSSAISASLLAIRNNVSLSSTISAVEMEPYSFDPYGLNPIKTTEVVVHLTYAGIFKTFEVVETSFKSLVKEYYYSSDGGYAWKKDKLDRWLLNLKSYLPKDTAKSLKRRLHKATWLYNLKRFSSIDEAMRFAIAYVTEYPQADLSNSIYGRGRYASLGASIVARYTREDNKSLSSTITAVAPTIIVGIEQGGIIKM